MFPSAQNLMQRKFLIAILAAFMLASCGTEPLDRTRGWSADRLYEEAREEMLAGNYEQATKHFEALEARYPFGLYAQQAQIEVAYAYYRQQETAQALAAVDRFLRLHPNHVRADYMYYLRGLIHQDEQIDLFNRVFEFFSPKDQSQRDLTALQQAFDSFRQLVVRFPDSPYAGDARARMATLAQAIAQYEVNIANYYFRRGAYVAAANRAEEVVKNHQQSAAVEEALAIMVRSYQALDLPQLRDDARRVLLQNFPNTTLIPRDQG
jgi:outer membrane protein assembly factor BamD